MFNNDHESIQATERSFFLWQMHTCSFQTPRFKLPNGFCNVGFFDRVVSHLGNMVQPVWNIDHGYQQLRSEARRRVPCGRSWLGLLRCASGL